MAKGSRGGRGGAGGGGPVTYSAFTDADASNFVKSLPDIYDKDKGDPDITAARNMYIADNTKAYDNNTGYAWSQNMNYKLDNGIPLDPTEKFIDTHLQRAMQPIGKDSNLTRFCHEDFLKSCGISNYSNLSESQLQSKLVGAKLKTTSYMSTSYDAKKSPFAPNAPQGGGREVVLNLKTGKNTPVTFGRKSQAEVVVNKGVDMKITGVHYDGTYAYPRTGGRKPRVVIDVEI